MPILVTGGAGFIGSAVARYLIEHTQQTVVVLDKLTYAGSRVTLESAARSDRFRFIQGDICDKGLVQRVLDEVQPRVVLHLAAESHVDRSIDAPDAFVQTNIVGTYALLQATRGYWSRLEDSAAAGFRFLHVSTDEVYGTLGSEGSFRETSPYNPSSPYSASKAASDHLVRAWHRTYGLPVVITNCSNNYGPYQFPEKLIPRMIANCRAGEPLPVYGRGDNIRDWLYVEDHVRALATVLDGGKVGETYNIGGGEERSNLSVVQTICDTLDRLAPRSPGTPHRQLIEFVADRPGHDFRYAVDSTKIRTELGWKPRETFETGLEKTVRWYLDHPDFWTSARRSAPGGH